MTYYVVRKGEYEDYEIVGITADKDWAERYCAIHEDCIIEKYEMKAGLEMTQEELMIPLNTEVIVKWDVATETADIYASSRTTHDPTAWEVDHVLLTVGGACGSIYLKKIFFGKLERDIDRNRIQICMGSNYLFRLTLDEQRALEKKERMVEARNHLSGDLIEARVYHHGIGSSGRYPWAKYEDFLPCERRLEPEIEQIVKEETGIDFEINDDISQKLGKLRKALYNMGYEYDGMRIREKKLKFVFNKHVAANKDLYPEASFDYNDVLKYVDVACGI